jgi:hypothetical protein
MAKSISVKRKKAGRPATGTDPLMGFRASPLIRASIVKWAENQPDTPTLSEAIRRLVEIGLAGSGKPTGRSEKTAAKAKELAEAQIDRMVDESAPVEEQASRKRRLLKGPDEFREVRVDRARVKSK